MTPGIARVFTKSSGTEPGVAAQSSFLNVESILDVCGSASQKAKARTGLCSDRAHEKVRAHPRGVAERDEGVVVDFNRRSATVQLRIDVTRGPEENQRLVDEMTPKVVEEPACFLRRALLAPSRFRNWTPSLEA